MTPTLYFANEGLFDVRAMMTFGVSAKENNNAIGYFGTGFKYAVAIILKLGGSISIKTGDQTLVFTTKKEQIRDKEFSIVYMNDHPAGFTTHLGSNWEPWMSFREIYCNCTDEGGQVFENPVEADTVVIVNCELFYKAWRDKDDYFISGTPIEENHQVQVYANSKPYIYYRGVAVGTVDSSSFAYNIKSKIDLCEDRSVKYSGQISSILQQLFQSTENETILENVIKRGELYEQRIGFDRSYGVTEKFIATYNRLARSDCGVSDSAIQLMAELRKAKGDFEDFYLTKTQMIMLEKAKKFLLTMDINVDDFTVKTVNGLGDQVMGMAKSGVIYLSPLPFQMGTKQVTSTVLEEWVHNKTGAKDFDRKMQNWLFDKILSVGEEMNGEPL